MNIEIRRKDVFVFDLVSRVRLCMACFRSLIRVDRVLPLRHLISERVPSRSGNKGSASASPAQHSWAHYGESDGFRVRLLQFLVLVFLFFFCFGVQAFAQEKAVQRIVSLGPVITEELYLLSSEDRIVGVTTYCERPSAAKLKERVGNVQEINIEKIVALKPDVVLATVLTDPRAKEKLRRLGVRVVDVPNAIDFDGICKNFQDLGQIVGKEKEAAVIIAEARSQVDALRMKMQGVSRVNVFVQVGANPLVTIGKDSFADDFIQFAGGVNIVTKFGYLRYSMEQILVSDPDVILISSMGFDGEKEKKNWEKFTSLKAVVQNKLFVLDQYLLCSPTPVTFVDMLRTVIQVVHPEVVL